LDGLKFREREGDGLERGESKILISIPRERKSPQE